MDCRHARPALLLHVGLQCKDSPATANWNLCPTELFIYLVLFLCKENKLRAVLNICDVFVADQLRVSLGNLRGFGDCPTGATSVGSTFMGNILTHP